ncbi:MAG: RNA ligase family protein [Candidatus Woesearchaeota archaeon]
MFKKYPSIENHYRQKFVDGFLSLYPELKNQWYIITEKRDGSNICLIFRPHKEDVENIQIDYKVASRNRILGDDENFYGVRDVLPKYSELIKCLQILANDSNVYINAYFELFGSGIQNRINYGKEKYIELFDLRVLNDDSDFFMSPDFIHNDDVLSKYTVPVLGTVRGIDDALNFKPEGFDEGKIEGMVIKPYYDVYTNKVGKIFYIKKKSPEFSEKENKEKKKEKPKFDKDVEELHRIFGQYITRNRVLSIFSKHGEIQDPKQIGEYIKLVLEDAKEDFFKDGYVISERDSKEIKHVYNHSKKIVPILQEYL